MSNFSIKTDFPAESAESWRVLVEAGLRGAELESLNRKTENDIRRGPLLSAADLPPTLAALGRTDLPLLEGRTWHIAAPVRNPDIGQANSQLLEDLKGGASAVRIEGDINVSARQSLKRLLEGVFTDLVPIQFARGVLDADSFEHVLEVEKLKTAHLWSGLDPSSNSVTLSSALNSAPDNWRLMCQSHAAVHESGGTDIQELASLAGALAESVRIHGGEIVSKHMVIELAADRDTHLTIAKFRAARRLIHRIADAFGFDGGNIPLCAVTSLRMMQTQDAWTNLLRIMSAGFGAVIGGADMFTTRPFTDGLGHATPFAHRIARNMQLMMMEESHLGQVTDAAHGSYWHETMTENLAQSAWAAFQKIEAAGGMSAHKNSGQFKTDIEKSIAERAKRGAPILGVTLHPDDSVKSPEVLS